jgi:hypothetical protein
MTSRKVIPIETSTNPVLLTCPDGIDLVPGLEGVPKVLNIGAMPQDGWDIRQCLYIVDEGWLAPQTIRGRIRWARARFSAFASIDSSKAVSSPQTFARLRNAHAVQRNEAEPKMFFPSMPYSLAC